MRCPSTIRMSCVRMATVLLLCLLNAGPARSGELLAFPSVTGVIRDAGDDIRNEEEIDPGLDIFMSVDRAPLQLLAEFFVNRDERELERLQIGVTHAEFYKTWIGRFHTPISYWNTAYHHGVYMQPSITRPGISEYEDALGVMPMHTFGILMEGSTELTTTQMSYDLALGFGPVLKEILEPVDVLAPDERGKLGVSAKLGLHPLNSDMNETGIFAGYIETPIKQRPYSLTRQLVAGAYFNNESERWRFVGEVTFMRNDLKSPQGISRTTFGNGYVQGEYKAFPQWTGYGRVEETCNTRSPYLNMFPGFVRARTLIGARWEPFRNQAIKFELASSERRDDHRSNELAMQWSMVFP